MTAPDVTDLDRLVLTHYRVWLAFTAQSSVAIVRDCRYVSVISYLVARGFAGFPV